MPDHVPNPLPELNFSMIKHDQPEAFNELVRWLLENEYHYKGEELLIPFQLINDYYDVDLIEKYFRENKILG
ncbi:hypothetical protein CLV58_113125 [Spirosoma oryzae]|uniref:Uncharacterized protein n=2 Tax=Spirosoma oryzae TaxID=1469603 RepID=A0A2T0SRF5_9BACT|nr:hypothetical protein CLV58_113125 [Spirosoma oryzae]